MWLSDVPRCAEESFGRMRALRQISFSQNTLPHLTTHLSPQCASRPGG